MGGTAFASVAGVVGLDVLVAVSGAVGTAPLLQAAGARTIGTRAEITGVLFCMDPVLFGGIS